ncbi:MAG: hypothetical protein NTV70_12825 [Acidobacteria bacterium]|nr:hypothetical protein [Acidobacteriota bacterium]
MNVWLALAAADHPHHQTARAWFQGGDFHYSWFCRVSQMGFLRLLTRPPNGMTAAEAMAIYHRFLDLPNVRYSIEPDGLEEQWLKLVPSRPSGSTWTDSYLAAFAQVQGFRLTTFDRGFRQFSGLDLQLIEDRSK